MAQRKPQLSEQSESERVSKLSAKPCIGALWTKRFTCLDWDKEITKMKSHVLRHEVGVIVN